MFSIQRYHYAIGSIICSAKALPGIAPFEQQSLKSIYLHEMESRLSSHTNRIHPAKLSNSWPVDFTK